MQLRDGILAVRDALGEMTPNFWSNAKIIADLNRSARKLCSAGQFLNSTYTVPGGATPGQQEYELPDDCETVLGVSVWSGALFQLKPMGRQQSAQVGGPVLSIPARFYTRRGSLQMSPQGISGQRVITNVQGLARLRMIIGLYPTPLSAYPMWVDYIPYHPTLKNFLDECLVPDQFCDAWYSYAIAQGKIKQGSLDEAQAAMEVYNAGLAEFKAWQENEGQEAGPPMYGEIDHDLSSYPASTVIVVDQNPGIL